MKKVFALIAVLFVYNANGQFLDLNIFKPRIAFDGEYVNNTQESSLSYWNSGANLLFPIKGKLDFEVDWKGIFNSKSIKQALGNVTPKAYQLFGEIGFREHQYITPSYFGNYQSYKAGITGVWLKYQNNKIRTLFVSANVHYTEGGLDQKSRSINPTLFIGTSVVHSLKNFVVIGGYASYYGNRFIGSPVLVWYHRFSSDWSSTIVLPVQAKLTWSKSRKFKQELVASLFGLNHAVSYQPSSIEPNYSGVNTISGIRLSTQSKIKLKKQIDFYIEVGWQEFTQSRIVNGYLSVNNKEYDGSLFAKMRFNIAISKALLKPSLFDFGL